MMVAAMAMIAQTVTMVLTTVQMTARMVEAVTAREVTRALLSA